MTNQKIVTTKDLDERVQTLCDKFEVQAEENIKRALFSCEKKHQQMLDNFKAHTNHVREELQGASEDQLSLHSDILLNHDQRIEILESA